MSENKKILIVDDDPINLKMAEHILLKSNFEVVCVNSGYKCLSILRKRKFDLVLLDIEMPELSGIATLELIRKDVEIANNKVAFLTSSGQKNDVTSALLLGALDFIRKPLEPEELLQRIHKAISLKNKDTILVVDDDSMALMYAQKILGVRYFIELKTSGEGAIEYLKENTPDLILLDYHMPVINGLQVMEEIQKSEKNQDVPIVFMTSDSDQETEIAMFKAGAMDFIKKPIVPEVVIQRISRILEIKHSQDALKNDVLERSSQIEDENLKMKAFTTQLIQAISNAVDAKNTYTRGHSRKVAVLATEIAKRVGKTKEYQEKVYYAALLHDIGKIGIPDDILMKTTRLLGKDQEMYRIHPVIGKNILENVLEIPEVYEASTYHHERFDGKGYPEGLSGESIPEVARIIAVADYYDNLSSKRGYRDPLSKSMIQSELEKGKGSLFDPVYAEMMLEILEDGEINLEGIS